MPVGNLLCVVRYTVTSWDGTVSQHAYYKRVHSGREGIALRDRIVTLGPKKPDHRVFILSCRLITLNGGVAQAA